MQVPGKLRGEVSEATLDAIARAVDEVEATTSGEIVVHLISNLLPFEKPRARALREFVELDMKRTRKRNGVLLVVIMKKRCFEIVADEGIGRKVAGEVWDEIAEQISKSIEHQGFEKGVCEGVALIGGVLAKHFPPEEGDVDELPDRPRVE